MCHEKLGRSEEEEADYIDALRLNPTNVSALYHMGLFYERQEKYKEAMDYFQKLVQVDPNFPPVYNARGMIYDRLEDYPHSYSEFTKAIELDKSNAVFYHNRGCCLKNMEKY